MSFLRSCFVSVEVDELGSAKIAETFGKSIGNCAVLMFPLLNEVG